MHSDSVSSAFERRMAFSRIRERMTSASVGLEGQYETWLIQMSGLHTVRLRKLATPLERIP